MNRTRTFSDGLKFIRNAFLIALGSGILLFRNSPHPAEEIAVAIAVPLIIFNCIPVLLVALAPVLAVFLPEPPQAPQLDLGSLSVRARLARGAFVAMLLCFMGGCAILLASFAYQFFDVGWAAIPARRIALVLFGTTALPLVAVLSFVAGMAYTGKVRDSAIALSIYLKTIQIFRHWPTYA